MNFLHALDQSLILRVVSLEALDLTVHLKECVIELTVKLLSQVGVSLHIFGSSHLNVRQFVVDCWETRIWLLCLVKSVLDSAHAIVQLVDLRLQVELYLPLNFSLVVHQRLENLGDDLTRACFCNELFEVVLLLPKLGVVILLFILCTLWCKLLVFGLRSCDSSWLKEARLGRPLSRFLSRTGRRCKVSGSWRGIWIACFNVGPGGGIWIACLHVNFFAFLRWLFVFSITLRAVRVSWRRRRRRCFSDFWAFWFSVQWICIFIGFLYVWSDCCRLAAILTFSHRH